MKDSFLIALRPQGIICLTNWPVLVYDETPSTPQSPFVRETLSGNPSSPEAGK